MHKIYKQENKLRFYLFILFLSFGFMGMVLPVSAQNPITVGWLESVQICPENLTLRAKLDTGAKTSSLNAFNIKEFDRQNEKFIQFDVVDNRGSKKTIEKKLIRYVKIKEHDTLPVERPVILLSICLGSVYKQAEVNLIDRSAFNYRLLIGRRFLEGTFLIDSAAKFTTRPHCPGKCVP